MEGGTRRAAGKGEDDPMGPASSIDDPRRTVGPVDPRLFRISVATMLCLVAIAPPVVRSAIGILSVESTTPIEWVPAAYPPRVAYDRFTAEFGSGDVIVASWPGCTVGSPGIARFVAEATAADAPRDPAGRPWFDEVVSGSDVVDRLTAEPLSLEPDEAIRRLRGVLVGPDGVQTCVVIGFTRAGLVDRRRATTWVRERLAAAAGVADADLHLAGPVIDNVSVDDASAESLRVYGPPAGLLIFLLTWWSLGSLVYAAVVFVLALECVGLSFLSLHAWGDRMNPVLIVMPLLVLTLGVSGGIHLVNYLVESRTRGPAAGAERRAIRVGWLPCLLSAGTTALGLGSLVVSELEPIRVFGFHAAVGVMATLTLLFLVLPGLFSRWPIEARRAGGTGDRSARFAAFTLRRRSAIVTAAAAAMAAAAAGLPGLRTSVAIDTLFTPETRVIRDYRWLESHVGPLVPVEVVLRFAPDSTLRAAERLAMVREAGEALGRLPGVTGVVSAATFLPDAPPSGGTLSTMRRTIVARKLGSALAGLSDLRVVRDAADGQSWRVTARSSALAGIDYGEFLERVREEIEPIVAARGGDAAGVEARFTGVMPLIGAIQKTLLGDLFSSFLSALVVISAVMMTVEGGVVAGAVAMIPNVFPMLLLFGLLGWTGTALDIGSVMTASIALGMAVDGTFHFLTFFRRALGRHGDAGRGVPSAAEREAAVHAAFRHSAAALGESSTVCGIGILAFAASSFAPTRQFAWMLALLVAAALAGDLVVLPALLGGPAGRLFRGSRV